MFVDIRFYAALPARGSLTTIPPEVMIVETLQSVRDAVAQRMELISGLVDWQVRCIWITPATCVGEPDQLQVDLVFNSGDLAKKYGGAAAQPVARILRESVLFGDHSVVIRAFGPEDSFLSDTPTPVERHIAAV